MRVEIRDSLEFPYPDSQIGKRPVRSAALDVARGGIVSVHLLLNDLRTGGSLRLNLRAGGRIVPKVQWYRLVDVPVEINTGPVGFVEKGDEENRFVIRRAPFRVYDAMAPAGSSMGISSSTMALRMHLPVSAGARAGAREYTLEVRSGRESHTLRINVHVHRPVIPPVGRESFPYTNWFSLSLMARRHGIQPWSEEHWRMIRRYADLMAHGRQNTFWCTQQDIFQIKRGVAVLDRPRLRRMVKTFTDAGMYFIEGGHFATRTGGEWRAATFDLVLKRIRATTDPGHRMLVSIARQLMEEIDRQGWRERWIQHIADEPVDTNAADYRILTGMVRKYMPGIPILDATMDPALVGSVDIWCPQAQEYQKHLKAFEAHRSLGDRVWFYTCCFPGGPWLNRLLDMELLRPALFGWGAALYQLDGFLHWGLNHYRSRQDPFQQSVVDHGGGNCLPAGDTHIVYPGMEGPWSSLRLEAQREGFEDYELLRKLRSRDDKTAQSIIRKAIRGFDTYTRDVKKFRAARRSMLEALAP